MLSVSLIMAAVPPLHISQQILIAAEKTLLEIQD